MELPRFNAKNSTNMKEQNKKSMPQFRIKEPCPNAVKPKGTSNQQPAIAVDEEKNFAEDESKNQPKTYNIKIDGTAQEVDEVATENGVYFILQTKISGGGKRQVLKYVGQANREEGGMQARNSEHIKNEDFPNSDVEYAYAIIDDEKYTDVDFNRIEYALIYSQDPDWNKNGDKHYNYGKTTINISGNCPWIRYKHFTIENDKITKNN